MDALFAIYTRRSVRQYAPGKVEEDQIDKLLRAGMAAPSAGNSRPWHFIVIDDPEKLAKVPTALPYAQMAAQAALAIMVCADPGLERFPGYWPQDCAAATQNILLAAHAQGLGAVWCGIYPGNEEHTVREIFDIPKTIMPLSLIVIGKDPTESKDPGRYDADRVHRNRFNPV